MHRNVVRTIKRDESYSCKIRTTSAAAITLLNKIPSKLNVIIRNIITS